MCDSIAHCDDGSDEVNCTALTSTIKASTRTTQIDEQKSNKKTTKKNFKTNHKQTTRKVKQKLNEKDYFDSLKEQEELESLLNENNDESSDSGVEYDLNDDYDDYKLLKQQNSIIEHLKELEQVNRFRVGFGRKGKEKEKEKIAHETPKDFLDSFMKESFYNKNNYIKNQFNPKTSPYFSITRKTTKSRQIFHGILLIFS